MKNVTLENGTCAESYSLWEFLDLLETDIITKEFGHIQSINIDGTSYGISGRISLDAEKWQDLALMCLNGRKINVIWIEKNANKSSSL